MKATENHENTVRQALSAGKPVPPEVLADYDWDRIEALEEEGKLAEA